MSILWHLVREAANSTDGHGHEHDHDEHDHTEHDASESYCSSESCLRNWKIIFAVALVLEGVVFGYVALLLRKFARVTTKRFLSMVSLVNIFGGGVFLATGLLHILPEALEFLSGEGHGGHEDHDEHSGEHANDSHASHDHLLAAVRVEDDHDGHGSHGFPVGFTVVLATFLGFLLFDRILFGHSHSHSHTADDHDHHDQEADDENPKKDETVLELNQGFTSAAFATASLMTLGIAAHSVFESIALGSSSRFSTVLHTFIAIATHRWATTMTLGARYVRSGIGGLPFAVLVVAYALVAAVGIGIGMAVRNAGDTFVGIMFALSAGIFLYIGAFEAPADEFVANAGNKWSKYILYVIGAAVITIITAILSATGVH